MYATLWTNHKVIGKSIKFRMKRKFKGIFNADITTYSHRNKQRFFEIIPVDRLKKYFKLYPCITNHLLHLLCKKQPKNHAKFLVQNDH